MSYVQNGTNEKMFLGYCSFFSVHAQKFQIVIEMKMDYGWPERFETHKNLIEK